MSTLILAILFAVLAGVLLALYLHTLRHMQRTADKLWRYQTAAGLAQQWLVTVPHASVTAEWIRNCGEGHEALANVPDLRADLEKAQGQP